MNPGTREGRDPPSGTAYVEHVVDRFLELASEHFDSALVLIVGHPEGHSDTTRFAARAAGNPYDSQALRDAWLDGNVPNGRWLSLPSGAATLDDGGGYGWTDGSGRELELMSNAMAEELSDWSEGILVLATCGEGPEGTTKTWAMAYGNSLACAGALATWIRSTDG